MKIIILGPPGSGKGTQAEILSKHLAIPHISTGDILRQEVKAGSELGQKVTQIMAAGDLVDDETIMAITIKALNAASNGFILDGVPRSIGQADALHENGVKIEHVLELYCPDETIIERITNRWIHPASGRVYNLLSNPPQTPGKDDETGEPLIQRDDDQEETVRNRLTNYHSTTAPLLKYYQDLAAGTEYLSYHRIESNASPQELAEQITNLLRGN